MAPLDSCVNTHNPSGAINRQQHAILENGCPHNRPNHTRDAILSGNNRAVAKDATGIRNHSAGSGEKGCPGRHRHLADKDISGLDFAGLGQVADDRRSTMNSAGRGAGAADDVGVLTRLCRNAENLPQNRLLSGVVAR
jgi:hypothetical protein